MARPVMRAALIGLTLALCSSPAPAAVFHPASFTLSNGMQIVIVQNRLSPAVAQMVWYKVGAADDPDGKSGLAHYLEHMMFKGTADLPDGAFSAAIAAMGGEENAFTSQDATAFHVTVAAQHLGNVMAMEADRMRGLASDPKLAASELEVVKSERQERTDNKPQGLFAEKMNATSFPDHPYGRPVIGWAADLARLTPEDAAAYYKAHYAPNNAILVISGNVEIADVLRLASGTFGAIPAQRPAVKRDLSRAAPPREARVEMQDARVGQPTLVRRIRAPSFAQDARRSYALEVLAEVLTGDEVGLLTRFFQMERQSAAQISASYNGQIRGPASFMLSVTPAPDHDVRKLEKDINAFLDKLARQGIAARDVAAAKQRLEDAAIFARDRLMAPAHVLGLSLATGQSVDEVEAWPQRIRAVTAQEVTAALRALVTSRHSVTGILEPPPAKGGG